MPFNSFNFIEWKQSEEIVTYPDALRLMEERVASIIEEKASGLIWLLEHPPLYTAGTSAKSGDLLTPERFPVFTTGRGGQYTYHGPGQRIAYVMIDLKKYASPAAPDIRHYVWLLEEWIIRSLSTWDIAGERREGRVGIWVKTGPYKEEKIAAIGIRIRKWVTYHGIALNVAPDLSHFNGIIPCGIKEYGVTSLAQLGKTV